MKQRIVAIGKDSRLQKLSQHLAEAVYMADDLVEATDMIQATAPDLLIFDQIFGPDCVTRFLNQNPSLANTPVMIVNADPSLDAAYRDAGASACLEDCCDFQAFEALARPLINPKCQTTTSDFFLSDLASHAGMVGQSPAMAHTLRMVEVVGSSKCNPVLLVGETGTGKEVIAKAIHIYRHVDRPFIAVNCAALTANLLESELFGHAKGSFTSADREKTGLLELAEDGTLFLDEISEMPLDMQAKLLRVIQEKTFRKVGGIKEIRCRATIVASTNRNLNQEVQANRFRRDLYYRLNVFPITLATLNADHRNQDIALLSEFFLSTSGICPDKTGTIKGFTRMALNALEAHHWPGNVRELKNVIERAILLEPTDKIGLGSIVINAEQTLPIFDADREDMAKDFSLEKAERELIAKALQETRWQKTKAAELLGISRATLYSKVKQHSIENTQDESETPDAILIS
ncbi:MAG: sigma-54-dependent Fis family transcriptional regulator [Phycisphaeraceae bacterium]|nr:sigma-54-dependent Fis family transcriptional regulator [Phycisphaeraceae bacterium]